MKFGVREICDVVLKAKATMKVGSKTFYKHEPVIYFDTLKTSSMEGAATTVYAQGGRGNSRLVAWEGERTVTFTMEDALISPEGFMILSGAGLIEAKTNAPIYQHVSETVDASKVSYVDDNNGGKIKISLQNEPCFNFGDDSKQGNYVYVMFMKDGEIKSEPYIPEINNTTGEKAVYIPATHANYNDSTSSYARDDAYIKSSTDEETQTTTKNLDKTKFDSVLVDYYVARKSKAKQIEIEAGKFGGNFYLEASTLFRDQNGSDLPAEFIIPNCKIQSNFTFTMASSGDPSTFTFTMDAFPDYTRFDYSKKVLAAIQIVDAGADEEEFRTATDHAYVAGGNG